MLTLSQAWYVARAGIKPARSVGLNNMSWFGSYFSVSIPSSLSMFVSKFSTRLLFNTKG